MRDLDLQTLRLFAAVCEQRSIARVAEQESIVGSAISKRLAQLEDTVGTPLLLRKRRGVVPTPAGETLLEHARTMLASVGQIERDMAAYATGTRGHVRMLVTASVMAESLADDVAAFLQDPAHRDIQVSLEERVSPDVVQGIRDGSASIGICWDAADLTGLETCGYRTDHLAVVAHALHPVAQHQSVRFADVLDHEFVSMPALSAVQVLLARAAAVEGRCWHTGCWCPTSMRHCGWCGPTWPSVSCRAKWPCLCPDCAHPGGSTERPLGPTALRHLLPQRPDAGPGRTVAGQPPGGAGPSGMTV